MPLDQREFARRIYQGLGRPLLFLRGRDPRPYTPALLHACRTNPVYDRQCTGSRADYLREILLLTGLWPDFRRPLMDALADPNDHDDTDQLADFALFYAREGDQEARRLLYEHWSAQDDPDEFSGADLLIQLDGLDGFLYAADRLGEKLLADSSLEVSDYLLEELEKRIGKTSADTLREVAGRRYPFARHYLDAVEHVPERPSRSRADADIASWPYARLRQHFEQTGGSAWWRGVWSWGESASPEDLCAAAADLLRQTSPRLLAAYLAIFKERAFPLGLAPLLPLLQHEQALVVNRALAAISMLPLPEVRELAFAWLDAEEHISTAAAILARHNRPGDQELLAELLARTRNENTLHHIGWALSDVFKRDPRPDAAPLFAELYERGPCSLCRPKFVERLIEIDALPDWMREEARYDSDPDTRALVS